jgi:branched-chain amino acid transport system substrate-binding protein
MTARWSARKCAMLTCVLAMGVVTTAVLPAAASGAPKASAAGTTITIAHVADQTSPQATTPVKLTEDVVKAWLKAHKNQIAGHPAKLLSRDTKGDPAVAKQTVEEFIGDGAVAFVAASSTLTENAYGDSVKAQGVPVVGGAAYSAVWFTNPMFYNTGTTVTDLLWGQAQAAADAGGKKVAQLLCNTSAACTGAKPLFDAAVKDNGMEIVSDQTADPTAPNYTAECLAAKNADADTFRASGIALNNVVRDCNRQQYTPDYLSSEGQPAQQALATDAGFKDFNAVGAISHFPYFQEYKQTKAFWSAMEKYASQYLPGGKQYASYGIGAAIAWSSMEALQLAIENSGVAATADVTSADIVKGLSMFQGETLDGLAPPLTFGDGTTANAETKCYWQVTIKNQKYTPTNGFEVSCKP